MDRKLKTIFPVSGIFPGKSDSVILLGFECTISPQNLIKIVGTIFEKIIFFIFSYVNYLQEDPRYRIWTRSVDWFRLYDQWRTDRQTDAHTHTHTQTFFLKHIFRLWEWCRIKNHKKIKVEFFDECNTSFTPTVARK